MSEKQKHIHLLGPLMKERWPSTTGQRDLHGYELVGRLSMAQEALPVPLRCSSRRLPRSAVFGFILSFHLNVAELSLTDKNGTLLRDDSRFHTSMATMA